jgi:uncharacterized integral membrane protein
MERIALVSNALVGLALMGTGIVYGVLGMAICGAVVMVLVGIVGLFCLRGEIEEEEG